MPTWIVIFPEVLSAPSAFANRLENIGRTAANEFGRGREGEEDPPQLDTPDRPVLARLSAPYFHGGAVQFPELALNALGVGVNSRSSPLPPSPVGVIALTGAHERRGRRREVPHRKLPEKVVQTLCQTNC
jgi:hypothetical protein